MKTHGLCLLIPAMLAFAVLADAQELENQTIKSIRFDGLSQVSEQQVRARIEVQPGQVYDPRAVARDIRRLHELGYFGNIEVDADAQPDGIVLTYRFQEKRIIDSIRIIGNDKVRSRQIRGVLSWREGDAFVPEAYDEERDAILQLYESKGFPNATVDINVDEVAPARVRVTYAINEGRKARVRSIEFVGNETLSDRQLRKLMQTRRSWWFMGGRYDEATFEADLQRIVDEYGNYGRLEAEIVETEIVQPEGEKGVDIVIHVSEGPVYHVDTLEIAGNFVFNTDEIHEIIETRPGEIHNRGQVVEDADLIEQGYQDSGYISARVDPQVTLDRERKRTHIVYRVGEGDLKYVEEIKITGNTVTRDEVIRRDLLIEPGERFSGPEVRASQRRLENTRYFERVRITLEDPDDTDPFANLLVDVEEAQTGEFTLGAGYSTEEGASGYTQVRISNFDIMNWPTFSGGGQLFSARLSIGEVREEYNISFTDPEIFGYPLSFGIDLFDESYEYTRGTDFRQQSRGAQVRFGKALSPFVMARTALRYRDIDISDIPFFANPVFQRERGGSTTISSLWGINRNTIDSAIDPAMGSRHDLELEIAGLGGDNEYLKLQHDSLWYRALDPNRKWVVSLRTREGIAGEYGSSDFVPISDRFFVGGTSTVRGYNAQDIGPKVRKYWIFGEEIRVGGELRVVENVELRYRLGDRLRLYTFVDAGGVWSEASDFDIGDMKVGAGLGFGVDVPRLGPIRLDYGIPINPDDDQGSGRLHLQTGFRF